MGIGVFKPICAIDIDSCIVDGELDERAADIVAHMAPCYAERSPSGHGVRIICTVPDTFVYDKAQYYINKRDTDAPNKGIEVYVAGSTNKFVTVTGDAISGDVCDGSTSLQYVAEKYMKRAKPRQAPAQRTVTQFPAADWFPLAMEKDPSLSQYLVGRFPMEDESAKDAALMARLLYWCDGDTARAIELFTASPFAQGKDPEHRQKLERRDYLQRTAASVMPERTASSDNQAYTQRLITPFILRPARGSGIQDTLQRLKPDTRYTLDDKGFGELFADVYRDFCRYNVTAKEWFYYDGIIWQVDMGAMRISQKAKELADALLVYGSTIENERQKTDYLRIAIRYGQLRYRETMLKDARDKYFISQGDLDADLDLFNCLNGTYNLQTGEFRQHRPEDLLSKVSNVIYDPDASAERWERFMSDIMLGDEQKILYLQKILGYALTAETNLETCWILYGATTRNGKSTLMETIAYMMGNTGGYALAMQPQTLALKQNKDTRQASGDIARLDGCRFLNASEPPKRMLFDTALLKTLLGRDSITARHLFEREYEFIPHFKLFINTNFLPLIQDDSLFSSGRINVLTFDRHFEPHEQDKGLKDKLKQSDEISGIFNWCLEGLRLYRELGAEPPACVTASTADYRQSSDKIGNFISECLEKTGKNSKAGDVYQRFAEWCDDNGFGTENKGNFFDELKSKNIYADIGTVNGKTIKCIVRGYELIEEEPYSLQGHDGDHDIDRNLPL